MADWQALAKAHRAQQLQAIPPAWILSSGKVEELVNRGTSKEARLIESGAAARSNVLSEKELHITQKLTARGLLERMQSQELSAEEVTVAFCKRAAVSHQLVSVLRPYSFTPSAYTYRPLA